MGFSLKKIKKAAKKAAKFTQGTTKAALRPVRKAGRYVDLTSTKSLSGLGKYTSKVARPAVGGLAALYTAGGSVALAHKGKISKSTFGKESVIKSYAIGASVGTAIASGYKASAVVSAAGTIATNPAPEPLGDSAKGFSDAPPKPPTPTEGFFARLMRFLFGGGKSGSMTAGS